MLEAENVPGVLSGLTAGLGHMLDPPRQPLSMAGEMGPPAPTDQVTSAGRPVWRSPSGGQFSEVTRTIPLSPGVWVNAPSVFEGGRIIEDENVLMQIYQSNGGVDPLTGRPLDRYTTVGEAVQQAGPRSQHLMD